METRQSQTDSPRKGKRLLLILLPLVLVGGVIALFLGTDGAGLKVEPVVPAETLQVGRSVLTSGEIELTVRNTSPEAVSIAQININDAIWPFTMSQNPIPRLGEATIHLAYPWVEGDPYTVTLITSNSILIDASIDAATTTAVTDGATIGKLTLVGLYVGIIPVILGMIWLPLINGLSPHWLKFLMAATVGLLIFLGIDATAEAVEQAGTLAGPYQGMGLIGIGIVMTFALLEAIGSRQTAIRSRAGSRNLAFATMVAIGIGLHNLGEGMAIGASFAVGAASLGTFLVVGFIVQNVTEGLGIVVPLARQRPSIQRLLVLGVVAGGPAILGAWIGGFTSSTALAVLFLAIGAGAVFQVAWSIGREIVWKAGEPASQRLPLTAFSGLAAGMVALYIMGIFLK